MAWLQQFTERTGPFSCLMVWNHRQPSLNQCDRSRSVWSYWCSSEWRILWLCSRHPDDSGARSRTRHLWGVSEAVRCLLALCDQSQPSLGNQGACAIQGKIVLASISEMAIATPHRNRASAVLVPSGSCWHHPDQRTKRLWLGDENRALYAQTDQRRIAAASDTACTRKG